MNQGAVEALPPEWMSYQPEAQRVWVDIPKAAADGVVSLEVRYIEELNQIAVEARRINQPKE
jgi:hypothetical protein